MFVKVKLDLDCSNKILYSNIVNKKIKLSEKFQLKINNKD